ncbi:EpsG family protein [Dubosiella newyorkensis]|uniref:EpsG family protein n=1 Tax=Dubosiella newyorkensis TaxID=1862672 RepID=UPI00259125A4|nr:EpsG family protein [Dubosiella newyorkensis]
MIYLLVFFVSTLLFIYSEKFENRKRLVIEILAVMILCILAGSRNGSVGTDTGGYLQPLIYSAINSENFEDFLNSSWIASGWSERIVSQYEIGFTIFIYTISKIFRSVFVSQFFVQLAIVLPVYYVLKHTQKIPLWLGMLVFDFLLYNNTLNLIRQSVCNSLCFLVLFYWMKRDFKISLIWLLIAFFFHKSAVIELLIIGIYSIIDYMNTNKTKTGNKHFINEYTIGVIIIGIGVIFVVNINTFIAILSSVGFKNYIGYLGGGNSIVFNLKQIINKLPALFIVIYNFKSYNKIKDSLGLFYIIMVSYWIITSQFYGDTMVGGFLYGGRIGTFFIITNTLSFPEAIIVGKHRNFQSVFLISYLLIYWWYYFVYSGVDATLPFSLI